MRKQPRQVRFAITSSIRRALQAVNQGQVVRTYAPLTGNALHSTVKGIAPRTFSSLITMRMIEDDPQRRDGDTVLLKLTRAGQDVLSPKKGKP